MTHLAPKIILFLWLWAGLVINYVKHGEPQGHFNFWVALIVVAAETGLLYWSGWFTS